MPVDRPNKARANLPGLLTSFPLGRTLQSARASQARQFIKLVKRGISEYSHQLDGLERELAENEDGRSERLFKTKQFSYGPDNRDGPPPCATFNVPNPQAGVRLTVHQVQHIFELLGRDRRTLGRSGYPYIRDVIDEQERLFPDTIPVTREEIEAAWDDWSDEAHKRRYLDRPLGDDRRDWHEDARRRLDLHLGLAREQLEAVFRKMSRREIKLDRRGFPYADEVHALQREMFSNACPVSRGEIEDAWVDWISAGRRERPGRERLPHPEPEPDRRQRDTRYYRHGEEDDRWAADDGNAGKPLVREQIHHLLEVLNYKQKYLTDDGYPYRSDVTAEQVRIFPGTLLLSFDDLERAWLAWDNHDCKDQFRERSKRKWDLERNKPNGRIPGYASEQQDGRHERGERNNADESPERDAEAIFDIFDAHVVDRRLSRDALPILVVVNEDCRARGVAEFRTERQLLSEWHKYLSAAAILRTGQIADRGGPSVDELTGGEAFIGPLDDHPRFDASGDIEQENEGDEERTFRH